MDSAQMKSLVDTHIRAEGTGDVDGAVAVYTDDIEHDVVGFPNSPTPRQSTPRREFYDYLTANFRGETAGGSASVRDRRTPIDPRADRDRRR